MNHYFFGAKNAKLSYKAIGFVLCVWYNKSGDE